MTTLRFDDLRQYSDTLRSRSGDVVNVRFVEPREGNTVTGVIECGMAATQDIAEIVMPSGGITLQRLMRRRHRVQALVALVRSG